MSEELIFTAIVIASNNSDYRFIVRGLNILDATDNLIKHLQEGSVGTKLQSIRINPIDTELAVIQI